MQIVKSELPAGQYFKSIYGKRNIVLHHTVSSTAASALSWWKTDPQRVGTAFVIDKDGTIYQAFDPKYWAYHLGLSHKRNLELNRASIGIELVNEGQLRSDGKGGWVWNFLGSNPRPVGYKGGILMLPEKWRGHYCWAAYTDEQYEALDELMAMLLERFKLPPTLCNSLKFEMSAPDRHTVYCHHNVRTDKFDVSAAFDFTRLKCLQNKIA